MEATIDIPARLNRDHGRLGDHHEDVVHIELATFPGGAPPYESRPRLPFKDLVWGVDFGADPPAIVWIAKSDGLIHAFP